MRKFYNQSQYTACLRLLEGFEMPVVESAMCGTLPIVYDLPSYRRWFTDFAFFIPFRGELDKDDDIYGSSHERQQKLIDSLVIFFNNLKSLTKDQIDQVRNDFRWENIMPKIWEIICQ